MLDASLTVTVGDRVRFRFTVTNAGHDAIEVTFHDAGRADFVVYESDGDEEVWRWSDGQLFAQVLQTARFEPGEEAVFEESWPDARPGDYTAAATLRVREAEVTARTPFSV
jgi:plastocyanin